MHFKNNALIMMALACLLSLPGPANAAEDKALQGSWEGKAFTEMVYTFAKEGKLTVKLVIGGDEPPLVLEGTYSSDGDKITMMMPSEPGGKPDQEVNGTYKITDDTLTLIADGVKLKLTRMKK